MFVDGPGFIALHRVMGETCDYAAMRQEIASLCFGGNEVVSAVPAETGPGAASLAGGADGVDAVGGD